MFPDNLLVNEIPITDDVRTEKSKASKIKFTATKPRTWKKQGRATS